MRKCCPQIREQICLETHFQHEFPILGRFGQSAYLTTDQVSVGNCCDFAPKKLSNRDNPFDLKLKFMETEIASVWIQIACWRCRTAHFELVKRQQDFLHFGRIIQKRLRLPRGLWPWLIFNKIRKKATSLPARFKKIAWIWSHHLQWKFKLLAGEFTWGNKAKHCWVMSTNFLFSKLCWQRPAMFCLYTSSKLSRP